MAPGSLKAVDLDVDVKSYSSGDSPNGGSKDFEGAREIRDKMDLVTEEFAPALSRAPGESMGHFVKRLLTEGHTVPDAFLTVSASQIGQVMLTCPNAFYKAGVIPGLIFGFGSAVIALYTMWLLTVLYLERKVIMLKEGTWFDANGQKRKTVTQYHEVIGFHMGKGWQVFAQIIIALGLLGTSIAQVIACSGDMYYIDKSRSKREWSIIWGGILMVFALVPTFRHFRVLNVIALVGTTYTAILIVILGIQKGFGESGVNLYPTSAQNFFTGSAVLVSAMSAHSIALEMVDAMGTSGKFTGAYVGGWIWTVLLVVPHSTVVNFAWPQLIGKNDNVYGVLTIDAAVKASSVLMIIHQFVAFALYCTPLLYMWEKLIHTHTKPWYIRLPSRLPVAFLVWFLGVAFPFYGAINSLMGAINPPITSFALPAIAYNLIYRHQGQRDRSIYPPPKWMQVGNWKGIFAFHWFMAIFYTGFGIVASVFSVQRIVQNSQSFGVLAECYQCAAAAGAAPAVAAG